MAELADRFSITITIKIITIIITITIIMPRYMFRGSVGDQDWLTMLGWERPHLFHVLGCEYNKQVCVTSCHLVTISYHHIIMSSYHNVIMFMSLCHQMYTGRCYKEEEASLCDAYIHGSCDSSKPAKIMHRNGSIN